MTDSRVVNYEFNAVQLGRLIESTSAEQVHKALGYLSTWNFSFPEVHIFIRYEDTEIQAVYRSDNGIVGYVIGAVWHGDHFGFHS